MTAIWPNPPRTWNVGEIVTGDMMNTNVRNPLDYLKVRPVLFISDWDGTVGNTTSTSFVDIPGAGGAITLSGLSRVVVQANLMWGLSSAATAFFTVNIDGVDFGHASNGVSWHQNPDAVEGTPLLYMHSSAITDGAHTVKLRMRTSAVTLTIVGFSLLVYEVL